MKKAKATEIKATNMCSSQIHKHQNNLRLLQHYTIINSRGGVSRSKTLENDCNFIIESIQILFRMSVLFA